MTDHSSHQIPYANNYWGQKRAKPQATPAPIDSQSFQSMRPTKGIWITDLG